MDEQQMIPAPGHSRTHVTSGGSLALATGEVRCQNDGTPLTESRSSSDQRARGQSEASTRLQTDVCMQSATLHLYTLLSVPSLAPLQNMVVALGDHTRKGVGVLSEVLLWLARNCQLSQTSGVHEECYGLLLKRLSSIQESNTALLPGLVNHELLDALAEYLGARAHYFRSAVKGAEDSENDHAHVTMEVLFGFTHLVECTTWLSTTRVDFLHHYVDLPEQRETDHLCGQHGRTMQTTLLAMVILGKKLPPGELVSAVPVNDRLFQFIASSLEIYVQDVIDEQDVLDDSFQIQIGRGLLLVLSKLCTNSDHAVHMATNHCPEILKLLDVARCEQRTEQTLAMETLALVFPHIEDELLEDYVKRDLLDIAFHAFEDVHLRPQALVLQERIKDRVLRQYNDMKGALSVEQSHTAPGGRSMLETVVRRVGDCIRRKLTSKLWFLLHGMNPDQRQRLLVEAPRRLGRKPLIHDATRRGYLDLVRFLHEECLSDIDPEYQQRTSVGVAAASGHLGVLRYLVQKGARVGYVPSECINTPLMEACRTGQLEMVDYLISEGVDAGCSDSEGNTCVHSLLSYCTFKDPGYVLKQLLNHGADIDARNKKGATAMHLAAEDRDRSRGERYLRTLLGRGADFTVCNSDGYTPLGCAVIDSNKQAIGVLVEYEAHRSPCTEWGADVLQLAATKELRLVLEHLIEILKPCPERTMQAFELLVSHCLNRVSYVDLRRILKLRVEIGAPLPVQESHEVYGGAHTVTSLADLDLIEHDSLALRMYTLYLRECTLGKYHPKVCQGLEASAWIFRSQYQYDEAVAIQFYAMNINRERAALDGLLFSLPCMTSVDKYGSLLKKIQQDSVDTTMCFSDVLHAIDTACEQVTGVELAKTMPSPVADLSEAIGLQLKVLVDLVYLALRFLPSEEQVSMIRRRIRPVVEANPTNHAQEGVLHRAMELLNIAIAEHFRAVSTTRTVESLFLEFQLQDVLLECGAQAHHLDIYNQSALHVWLATCLQRRKRIYSPAPNVGAVLLEAVSTRLLDVGLHMDAQSTRGVSVESQLDALAVNVCKLRYIGLKCLAARVVKLDIKNYQCILPKQLVEFVNLH